MTNNDVSRFFAILLGTFLTGGMLLFVALWLAGCKEDGDRTYITYECVVDGCIADREEGWCDHNDHRVSDERCDD